MYRVGPQPCHAMPCRAALSINKLQPPHHPLSSPARSSPSGAVELLPTHSPLQLTLPLIPRPKSPSCNVGANRIIFPSLSFYVPPLPSPFLRALFSPASGSEDQKLMPNFLFARGSSTKLARLTALDGAERSGVIFNAPALISLSGHVRPSA